MSEEQKRHDVKDFLGYMFEGDYTIFYPNYYQVKPWERIISISIVQDDIVVNLN